MSLELLRKKVHEFIVKNYDVIQHNPEILEEFKRGLLFKVKELEFGDEMDYQDYSDDPEEQDDFENMEGYQVVDGDEDMEDDAAAQFLREAEAKESPGEQEPEDFQPAPEEDEVEEAGIDAPNIEQDEIGKDPEASAVRGSRWQPNESKYTDEHRAKLKEIMDQGFSHREAERMIGAHGGPSSFEEALQSRMDVPEMSEAFLNRLRPLAQNYISTYNERRIQDADPSKNRELAVRGKMLEDFKTRNESWNKAWKEHKKTDEYKNLSAAEKMMAKKKFRDQFLQENPDHLESFKNIDTAAHRKEAGQKFENAANEQLAALLTNNIAGETMSAQEAGQAIGAQQNEGGGYNLNTKGNIGSFAQQNRKFLENRAAQVVMDKYGSKLSQDQIDRLKRVTGAKSSTIGEAAEAPKAPKGAPPKPEGDGGQNAQKQNTAKRYLPIFQYYR